MRLTCLNSARIVSLVLTCMGLFGCGLFNVRVNSEAPYVNIAEEIQPARSTIAEVRALLGQPYLSSAQWRVDIFAREAAGTTYTVLWIYPIWWEKDSLDEYLMVTYSDQGFVTGVRSYEGGQCDFNCGGKIKFGDHRGLDLVLWGKRVILLASREDTARLVSTEPGPNECVVYLIPRHGSPLFLQPVYLDDHFVQHCDPDGFMRLVVVPGDHTISSLIESGWSVDSTPGHPLEESELYESEQRTRFTWDFSCTGGETLMAAVGSAREKWWRESTTHCVISPTSGLDAAEALSERRMIIPFDPSQ